MPIGQARKAEPNPGIDVDVLVLGIGALLLVLLLGASAAFGARRATRIGLAGSAPTRSTARRVPARQRPLRAVQPARRRHGPRPGRGSDLGPRPVGDRRRGVRCGRGRRGASPSAPASTRCVEDPAEQRVELDPGPGPRRGGRRATLHGRRRRRGHRDHPLRPGGGGRRAHDRRLDAGGAGRPVVHASCAAACRPVPARSRSVRRPPTELGLAIGDPVSVTDPMRPTASAKPSWWVRCSCRPWTTTRSTRASRMTPDTLGGRRAERRVRPDGRPLRRRRRRGRGGRVGCGPRSPEAISVYSFSSPPPDVANLDGVQFLPRVLGLFLGLLAIAAVGHALATSVRRRRHDLGIVRSRRLRGPRRPAHAHGPVLDARGHRAGLRHPARHRAGPGVLAAGRRADRGASHRGHVTARAARRSPWSRASRPRPCRCRRAWRRPGSARSTHSRVE